MKRTGLCEHRGLLEYCLQFVHTSLTDFSPHPYYSFPSEMVQGSCQLCKMWNELMIPAYKPEDTCPRNSSFFLRKCVLPWASQKLSPSPSGVGLLSENRWWHHLCKQSRWIPSALQTLAPLVFESGPSFFEAKGHGQKMVYTKWTDKSRLFLAVFIHFDLPVAYLKVKGAKMFGSI